MSCRHDLANGTCVRCYPKTGRIDLVREEYHEGNMEGPGAVAKDGGRWNRLRSEAGRRAYRMAAIVACIREEFPGDEVALLARMNVLLSRAGLALELRAGMGGESPSGRCESVRACEPTILCPGCKEAQDFRCDKVRGHTGDHCNVTAYPGRREVRWPNKRR